MNTTIYGNTRFFCLPHPKATLTHEDTAGLGPFKRLFKFRLPECPASEIRSVKPNGDAFRPQLFSQTLNEGSIVGMVGKKSVVLWGVQLFAPG